VIELVYVASEYIRMVGDYSGYRRPDFRFKDLEAEDTKVDGPTMTEVYGPPPGKPTLLRVG